MAKLKPINFIGLCGGYSHLTYSIMSGARYDQTSRELTELGYYLPEDQFKLFKDVLRISVDLGIGPRQKEIPN